MKNKLTKTLCLLLALVLCLGLLSACGGGTTQSTPAATQAPDGTKAPQTVEPVKPDVKYKESVRIAAVSEVQNGQLYQNTSTQGYYVSKLTHDALFYLDYSEGKAVAEIAKSAEDVNKDGKTWKVIINQGIKFHDTKGNYYADLTTEDVKFTCEYASPNAEVKVIKTLSFMNSVEDIEIVDDYTMIFHMKVATYDFPLQVTPYIVCKKAIQEMGVEGEEVGSGPYWINYDKTTAGVVWTLTRYDDYWKGIEDMPTKNIEFHIRADLTTSTAGMEAGEFDVLLNPGAANCAQLEGEGFTVYSAPATTQCFIQFNGYEHGMFHNPDDPNQIKLRQAIQLGIDKDKIVAVVYAAAPGSGVRIDSPFGKITEGFLDLGPTEYNVEKAQALMKELGYNENNRLRMKLAHYSSYTTYATLVQDLLKEIYIDVELNTLDTSVFGTTLRTGEGWDICVNYYGTSVSFISMLNNQIKSTASMCKTYGWNSAVFDAKVDEILSKPTYEEQLAAFKENQAFFRDYVPFITTHTGTVTLVTRPEVEGVIISPSTGSQDFEHIRIPEK